MVTKEDHEELAKASELLIHVIERHRADDLRVLSLFNSALQDIRVGERYLNAQSMP